MIDWVCLKLNYVNVNVCDWALHTQLEAAVVVLQKVGGGAVINFDHPNK